MSKVIIYKRRPFVRFMTRDCFGSVSSANEWVKEQFLRNAKSPYDLESRIPYEAHRLDGVWHHSGYVFGILQDMITVSVDGEEVKEFTWDRLTEEDLSDWEERFPYSLTQWDNKELVECFLADDEVFVTLED